MIRIVDQRFRYENHKEQVTASITARIPPQLHVSRLIHIHDQMLMTDIATADRIAYSRIKTGRYLIIK